MSHQQSPLGSFDPFATHPFTNGSGLMPDAPRPSVYPMQFSARGGQSQPSPPTYHSSSSSYGAYPGTSPESSGMSTPSVAPPSPLYAPQPQRLSPPSSKPIFIPYKRGDASSPELVLKKKVAYFAQ